MNIQERIKEYMEHEKHQLMNYSSYIADTTSEDEDEMDVDNIVDYANDIELGDEGYIGYHLGAHRILQSLSREFGEVSEDVAPKELKAKVINLWKDRVDRAVDHLEQGDTKRAIETLEKLSTILLLAK